MSYKKENTPKHMEWAGKWGRGGGLLLILGFVEGIEGLDLCFSNPG